MRSVTEGFRLHFSDSYKSSLYLPKKLNVVAWETTEQTHTVMEANSASVFGETYRGKSTCHISLSGAH